MPIRRICVVGNPFYSSGKRDETLELDGRSLLRMRTRSGWKQALSRQMEYVEEPLPETFWFNNPMLSPPCALCVNVCMYVYSSSYLISSLVL